jgi:hypothetical protein
MLNTQLYICYNKDYYQEKTGHVEKDELLLVETLLFLEAKSGPHCVPARLELLKG